MDCLHRIHRDQTVQASAKYEIIEESATTTKLIIHDVAPEDESPIQIKVRNALGQTDATVQLRALGKYSWRGTVRFAKSRSFLRL